MTKYILKTTHETRMKTAEAKHKKHVQWLKEENQRLTENRNAYQTGIRAASIVTERHRAETEKAEAKCREATQRLAAIEELIDTLDYDELRSAVLNRTIGIVYGIAQTIEPEVKKYQMPES